MNVPGPDPAPPATGTRLDRRAWLEAGSLVLAATAIDALAPTPMAAELDPSPESLRIALITDLHYADKPALGSRFYRESTSKLAEAAQALAREKPAFIVELGDLVDAADSLEVERHWLDTINRQFSSLFPNRHYVLGNHCVDGLTKQEFLGAIERERSYYSFDHGHTHFVILDACFRSDGLPYGRQNAHWTDSNIPAEELEWLAADLHATRKQTIVFVHQRLDSQDDYAVRNAPAVREVLQASGRVVAVLQGHSHENDLRTIQGIHYIVLRAMVEGSGPANNGYSLLAIEPGGTLQLTGFRRQQCYQLRP